MCFRAKNQGVDVETLVYELPADAKREEAHIPWTVKRAAMQRAQAARKHVATAHAKASSENLQAESASPASVDTPLVAPDMKLPTYAQLRTMSDQDIFDSVMNDQVVCYKMCSSNEHRWPRTTFYFLFFALLCFSTHSTLCCVAPFSHHRILRCSNA